MQQQGRAGCGSSRLWDGGAEVLVQVPDAPGVGPILQGTAAPGESNNPML